MRTFRALPILLLLVSSAPAPDLVIVTDQAEAALHILAQRKAGRPPDEASWRRLFASEGYRRLQARETAMGRSFEDSSFRTFLLSDTLLAREAALRTTLHAWRKSDLGRARARALAYLPSGTRIRARVYLLIKPRTNSFVFEADTDPAIMLYLDPARTRAQLENTVAHELHHIGYASACHSPSDSAADSAVTQARGWLSAFGEGVAMLAAAGGPEVHPHAESPARDRARWDGDLANAPEDVGKLESFLLDILDRRVTDADSIGRAGMSFFGIQGPWYTVGWLMASTVERAEGRTALTGALCDPVELLRRYDAVARARRDPSLPVWSERLLARLGGGD
jgi:hypothetical protein